MVTEGYMVCSGCRHRKPLSAFHKGKGKRSCILCYTRAYKRCICGGRRNEQTKMCYECGLVNETLKLAGLQKMFARDGIESTLAPVTGEQATPEQLQDEILGVASIPRPAMDPDLEADVEELLDTMVSTGPKPKGRYNWRSGKVEPR